MRESMGKDMVHESAETAADVGAINWSTAGQSLRPEWMRKIPLWQIEVIDRIASGIHPTTFHRIVGKEQQDLYHAYCQMFGEPR